MTEWLTEFLNFTNNNADGLGVIITLLVAIGGLFAWVLNKRTKASTAQKVSSGGHGGSASVGGDGVALGGRGGRGGSEGNGGNGGAAHVVGDGAAIGGDAGESGVSWRPALGAPSVAERQFPGQGNWPDLPRDEFGFHVIGRGGHGGNVSATILADGYRYPLLPLTLLLRLWAPNVLEAVDATTPENPQEFWNAVKESDPRIAKDAEKHTRYCLEVSIPKGLPAPDPYARVA